MEEKKKVSRKKGVTPAKEKLAGKGRSDASASTPETGRTDSGSLRKKAKSTVATPSKVTGKSVGQEHTTVALAELGGTEISREGDACAVPIGGEGTASVSSEQRERNSAAEPAKGGKIVKKKLSKEKLEKIKDEYRKRGVVYLSRIPPHMKPQKLRHMLSQYGEILRVYLAPEDSAARMRRKKAGKDRGKNFTEGWVEFARKKIAKRVAAMLNGEPMGGKRRSAYYYDLWNMKYLHKFKWDDLTAEIAYRSAVKEQRLAAEVSAAKRERDFYLSKVDQSRMINAMAERKRKRTGGADAGVSGDGGLSVPGGDTGRPRVMRQFSQRRSLADPVGEDKPRLAPDLLAKVFG